MDINALASNQMKKMKMVKMQAGAIRGGNI